MSLTYHRITVELIQEWTYYVQAPGTLTRKQLLGDLPDEEPHGEEERTDVEPVTLDDVDPSLHPVVVLSEEGWLRDVIDDAEDWQEHLADPEQVERDRLAPIPGQLSLDGSADVPLETSR